MKWILAQGLMLSLLMTALCGVAPPLFADSLEDGFLATLDGTSQQDFKKHQVVRKRHALLLDTYWKQVGEKRAVRRTKRKQSIAFTREDFIYTFPPEYKGPVLGKALAKAWADYQKKNVPPETKPVRRVPTFADALVHARKFYNFVPERVAEREFKKRYAREALALGLSKEQVLRVYALETGGQGTADMQSGIHPVSKKGTPISSAIGYAQLLHANTIDEIDNHGDKFVARLRSAAADPNLSPELRARLLAKITALRKMIANARAVPGSWDAHVAYGNTPRGMGIHAVNVDGDIGPWLQVIKLAGLLKIAAKAGRAELSGAEIELMNLAGPVTGLEMMEGPGLEAPTTNFFTRQAYGRNTVVRGRTSAKLLVELDHRMEAGLKKPGAIEFAEVFDEASQEKSGEKRAGR